MSGRRKGSSGYAMLAALLVTTLAAAFAVVVVAAFQASFDISAADAAGWRATGARARAVASALVEARWHPLASPGALDGGDVGTDEWWTAEWVPLPGSAWPRRDVQVAAGYRDGRRDDRLVLELRSDGWATGVSVAGDAEFGAPFLVAGSGVYAGGCVRGREHVQLVSGPGGAPPPDLARGEDFAVAAVHAAAGIFAAGSEVHESSPSAAYPSDGDQHTGQLLPARWVDGPSAEFLVAAAAEAERPGPALVDGVLHLDLLQPARPDALGAGRCLLLPRMDEVVIEGVLPSDAGRLLVVVPGDAVVGQPGSTVELQGALVVGGRLVIRGELVLDGPLHAGSLVTEGRAEVRLPSDWRLRPLPGAVQPVVVEAGT